MRTYNYMHAHKHQPEIWRVFVYHLPSWMCLRGESMWLHVRSISRDLINHWSIQQEPDTPAGSAQLRGARHTYKGACITPFKGTLVRLAQLPHCIRPTRGESKSVDISHNLVNKHKSKLEIHYLLHLTWTYYSANHQNKMSPQLEEVDPIWIKFQSDWERWRKPFCVSMCNSVNIFGVFISYLYCLYGFYCFF